MVKRIFVSIVCLFALVFNANAVLKEQNLENTLKMLRIELTDYHSELEKLTAYMREQQEQVRTELMQTVNQSNQNSLMLYSQREGYIFDLTYACHEATEQYAKFQKNSLPFHTYLTRVNSEIARYDSLISSLSKMPVMTLSERAQIDRNVCLTYAINIRRTLKANSDQLSEYIRYYQYAETKLKNMNDYANERYVDIQHSIFRNGGDSYITILGNLGSRIRETSESVEEKYKPRKHSIMSQWDSRIIFFLFTLIFFYGAIAAGINFVSIRFVLSRSKRFDNKEFKAKRTCIIMAGSVVTFAIILGLLQLLFQHQYFLIMASKLLVEFAWLMGVILISLLIRLNGMQIMRGFRIYAPIMFTGFLVIAFRIVLIPNMLVELLFPPILILCTYWQWRVMAKLRKPEAELRSAHNDISMLIYELKSQIKKLESKEYTTDEQEAILKQEIAKLQAQLAEEDVRRENHKKNMLEYMLPKSDFTYANISLAVFSASLILALLGYTLMSVQLLIWWVMQLTCILTITCLSGLMDNIVKKKYNEIRKKVEDYNSKHEDNLTVSDERFFTSHWFLTLVSKVVLPILGVVSFGISVYWASDVFNLSETTRRMLFTRFVDTEKFSASIITIMMAFFTFFVFRYINNMVKSLWKIHLENNNPGDQKTIDSRNMMGKNVIQFMVWGIWFIIALSLFNVSNSWILVISAALSTGIGFASKDILENIYYGISLMSGRVKVGDIILIDGIRGTVNSISYTSTTMETIDGSIIAFQNAQLFSKNYKNLTRNHGLELDVLEVGVAYGSDIQKVKEILIEAISKVPGVETQRRKVGIVLKSFGDSSIVLKILVWVDVIKQGIIDGLVLEAVYNALNENHIEIPFPQHDIHIIHPTENEK